MKVNDRISSSDISVCASALKPPFKSFFREKFDPNWMAY
jgi:hypothetical protein